jgi:polyisoprenoid-binding protein YceI
VSGFVQRAAPMLLAALACAGAGAEPFDFALDPTHTFVTFEALHFGTSTYRGRFDRKQGLVQIDRAAKTGHAEITIDLASVSTGVAALDRLLQSADFFDVAQNPSATFVGERFVFADGKVTEVAGTLTFNGRTNPVTLKASHFNCYQSPLFKREVCGGDFETVVQRSQWGLSYGLPAMVPDNIRLLVQVEAVRQ